MRRVVVDRFNGQPLKVFVEKNERLSVYIGLQAERVLAAVNCVLHEKVPSVRKKAGIHDKMTFVVIPNL